MTRLLDGSSLQADLAPLLLLFKHEPDLARELTEQERSRVRELCDAIGELAARRREFFSRFDYGWAVDPASYTDAREAWLQYETLIVLTEQDPEHPSLRTHRPTVVKILQTVDFASTSIRGERCDYVLIASPHFVLLRELAVFLRALQAAWVERGHEVPAIVNASWFDTWVATALSDLLDDDPAAVVSLFMPLQRHAVNLWQGRIPFDPPQMDVWIRDGIDSRDPLAYEIAATYVGIDRFLLFHELGHRLEGHAPAGPRSLAAEVAADRAALSLMIARTGVALGDDPPPGLPTPTFDELVLGPVTYLHLLRVIALFVGAFTATATLADAAFAPGDRALASARDGARELEVRLVGLGAAARTFQMRPLTKRLVERAVHLHALYIGACATLLTQADVPFAVADLPVFDVRRALGLLAEVFPPTRGA